MSQLGRQLYDACKEAFGLRGEWNPETKPSTCENYARAARLFAANLRARAPIDKDRLAGIIAREHGGDEDSPDSCSIDAADAVLTYLSELWEQGG